MPQFLLDDTFEYEGVTIHYKVSGKTFDPATKPIFILDLPSLAFASLGAQHHADQYETLKTKHHLPTCHFIYVDFPGSGLSVLNQPALNTAPNKESTPEIKYSIKLFTEVAIRAVQEVQRKLKLKQMQLILQANADASFVAMNIPLLTNWTDPNAEIRIRMIINRGANINGQSQEKNLEEAYKNDPKLPEYKAALKKLESGDIKDAMDLVRNVDMKIAPVLMDTRTFEYIVLKPIVAANTEKALSFFKFLKKHAPTTAMKNYFAYVVEAMAGANIAVLNKFSANQYDGTDILKLVKDNEGKFSAFPTLYIDSDHDALCQPQQNSQLLAAVNPHIQNIILPGKAYDAIREQYDRTTKEIFSGQLFSLKSTYSFSTAFALRCAELTKDLFQPSALSSTAKSFFALGRPVAAPVVEKKKEAGQTVEPVAVAEKALTTGVPLAPAIVESPRPF